MSADETKTDTRGPESDAKAPAAAANGSPVVRTRRPAAAEPGPAAAKIEPAPETVPCDDCPPSITGRDWSAGLGWLMVGAALALAFIGADLASRGALSRKLGAAGWDESER